MPYTNNTNLYRFISNTDFEKLIYEKKDTFRQPMSWKDINEGKLLKQISSENIKKELINYIMSIHYEEWNCGKKILIEPKQLTQSAFNYCKIIFAINYFYAKCWTLNEETPSLWNEYSYQNESVRILSNENNIRKELKYYNSINVKPINYNDKKVELLKFDDIFEAKSSIEPFFFKFKKFDFENEVRFMLTTDELSKKLETIKKFMGLSFEQFSFLKGNIPIDKHIYIDYIYEIVEEYFESADLKTEYNPNNNINKKLDIKIENPSKYIKSVLVHPKADYSYVKKIEKICLDNNIKFEGQSNLKI